MAYENMTTEGLRGSTLAHYLVDIEADFRLLEGVRVVYAEPYFPVVELARALHIWVIKGAGGEFEFDSMSFEEPGAISIVREGMGWVFGSRLTPETKSGVVDWGDILEGVEAFVASVQADLASFGIDPREIFSQGV